MGDYLKEQYYKRDNVKVDAEVLYKRINELRDKIISAPDTPSAEATIGAVSALDVVLHMYDDLVNKAMNEQDDE